MMQYRCIIFDLDGTLLDTSIGILKCVDYIVSQFGLNPLSKQEKLSFIGPPVQESFKKHYECTTEQAWKLATAWREVYKEKFLLEAVPYEGIYDLLRELQQNGYKTAIATNKREDYTQKLLEYFSFLPLFDCIIGSDFDGKLSKADMIRLCLKQIKITEPSQCLMVGDTIGDMMAAQEAGIPFLGVTYGFGFKKGVTVFDNKMADNCKEIYDIVKDLYLLNKQKLG